VVLKLNTLLAISNLNKSTSWDNEFRYRYFEAGYLLYQGNQYGWMNFEENCRFSIMTSTLWT
jgi:hypothetical protein